MKKEVFAITIVTVLISALIYADEVLTIKSGCLRATVKAITYELQHYKEKHKAASQANEVAIQEKMKSRIEQCNTELTRFTSMSAATYILQNTSIPETKQIGMPTDIPFGPVMPPIKKEVTITFKEKCKEGTLLDIDGITRSGPFYHVVGIVQDNYDNLKVGKRYRLILYLVYKKEYFGFIPNYYVYISQYKEL